MKTVQKEENFYNVFNIVLVNVPKRSRDIIAKRFGIEEEKPMTLQAIGDEYGITRERVRQIVQSGLKNACDMDDCEEYNTAKNNIISYIQDNHNIVTYGELEDALGGDDISERGAIRFLIEGIDNIEVINEKKYPVTENVIALSDFDIDEWLKIHNEVKDIFEDKQKVYTSDKLHEKIVSKYDIEHPQQLERYMIISREIDNNPFNKWGLCEWDEISPRGVREKALLIMKEEKKPMHFKEIAIAIDEYGLGKNGKKSHPQTVHNELIRDDNFVLVGRGVYTINTDNYVDGTVKDVIENILQNSDEPLSSQEVIERVLEMRSVKPSTVKVNLNAVAKKMNKKYTLDTNAS
jgi:hypothetical protein